MVTCWHIAIKSRTSVKLKDVASLIVMLDRWDDIRRIIIVPWFWQHRRHHHRINQTTRHPITQAVAHQQLPIPVYHQQQQAVIFHFIKTMIRLWSIKNLPTTNSTWFLLFFLPFSITPTITEGDASSPHGATCIQYQINGDGNTITAINSKSPSPSSPTGLNNEGLTRQQLDLISQIMQQTKNANGHKTTTIQRPRTWNMQVRSAKYIFGWLVDLTSSTCR